MISRVYTQKMDGRKIKCYDLYIKRKGKTKSRQKKTKNKKKLLTSFFDSGKITE